MTGTVIGDLDVLLTMHLSIFILVINQLDVQNFCFTVSLFHASTCFKYHVPIIRRSKLYYTAFGIITPIGVKIPEAVKQKFCASSWLITKIKKVIGEFVEHCSCFTCICMPLLWYAVW